MAEFKTGAAAHAYVLLDPAVPAIAEVVDDRLAQFTERHKFRLLAEPVYTSVSNAIDEIGRRPKSTGVLIKLEGGVPNRHLLKTTRRLMRGGRRVFYFWPAEGALELVDDLRLKGFWKQWLVYRAYTHFFEKKGATLSAPVDGNSAALVTEAMRTSAATILSESDHWRDHAGRLVALAHDMEAAVAATRMGVCGGTVADVAAALAKCGDGVQQANRLIARALLAVNRVGFCFEDLAKSGDHPALVGEIDPTHYRGIRQSVAGCGMEIGNVELAFASNLPGIRTTLEMIRASVPNDAAGTTKAASLEQVVKDNIAVACNLVEGLAKYCHQIESTAKLVLPLVDAGRELVMERLNARAAVTSPAAIVPAPASTSTDDILVRTRLQLAALRERIKPVPLPLRHVPSAEHPLPGLGLYLRTDYWAPIISGGSYGHTCYQARALARTSEDFACLMSNKFPLLEELGLRQVVVRPEGLDGNEISLLRASEYYYQALRSALELTRPAYIFERACLANFAAARLSAELKIPYIVEYNGSEISMKRSFDTNRYQHEDIFLEAEQATFEQATVISVISDAVRDDVVKRGIDPAKVLVNWNAVDIGAYGPLPRNQRDALRAELGFDASHRVVCFIGTFGGWHGIEVLAGAMPRICETCPDVRFLLIGEGNYKHVVKEAIESHDLQSKVVDCGRVPQKRGAELMGAADIFVSPHSSHMVDSRFFGSPTKLFEYMGYGVGIVASDLEQIGEVMRPSLSVADLAATSPVVGEARGVLCKPGDVDQFIAGVIGLARNPGLTLELGRNARLAAEKYYTWDGHVVKLWQFLARCSGHSDGSANGSAAERLLRH